MVDHGYEAMRAYCQSKLAQVPFGFRLAGQLDPAEVTVTSLHPATLMPTKMVLTGGGRPFDSLERGVAATTRLAVDPELEGITGVLLRPRAPGFAEPLGRRPKDPRTTVEA